MKHYDMYDMKIYAYIIVCIIGVCGGLLLAKSHQKSHPRTEATRQILDDKATRRRVASCLTSMCALSITRSVLNRYLPSHC